MAYGRQILFDTSLHFFIVAAPRLAWCKMRLVCHAFGVGSPSLHHKIPNMLLTKDTLKNKRIEMQKIDKNSKKFRKIRNPKEIMDENGSMYYLSD